MRELKAKADDLDLINVYVNNGMGEAGDNKAKRRLFLKKKLNQFNLFDCVCLSLLFFFGITYSIAIQPMRIWFKVNRRKPAELFLEYISCIVLKTLKKKKNSSCCLKKKKKTSMRRKVGDMANRHPTGGKFLLKESHMNVTERTRASLFPFSFF